MRLRRQNAGPPSAADAVRPFLYGDLPIDQWPPADDPASGEPWESFIRARAAVGGRPDEAVGLWLSIARAPGVESRHVLQAWTMLRRHGVVPTGAEASTVYGVVCEVAVREGHDVLAVYADGSSRYLNHAGGVVVEDGGRDAARAAADAVLAEARPLGEVIGLWDEPELPAVPSGHARLLLLTPGGFRFGQGPQTDLWREPMAAGVLNAATQLMLVLTKEP